MIAIVSTVLTIFTVLVMVMMRSAVRYMRAEKPQLAEIWEIIQMAGRLATGGTVILTIALIVKDPPQVPWEHPLLWVQAALLLVALLLAYAAHNVAMYYRRRRAGVQYTQMGYLQPSDKRH